MTPEQRKCINELCQKIQTESDQKKFNQLVYELTVFLEQCRVDPDPNRPPTGQ
jgi:hypothetical protein